MEIYLIRHTKTETQKGLCYGQSDVALSPGFETEFDELLKKLPQRTQGDRVYSSRLARCLTLAQQLSNEVIIDERLIELNFGDWEGIPFDSIDPILLQDWTRHFVTQAPPNGESFTDLCQRVGDFWQDIITQPNDRVFIVTHAGVIRALFAVILQCPLANAFQFSVDYASVHQLKRDNEYTYICTING